MTENIHQIQSIIKITKEKGIKILFNLIDDQNYFFNDIDKNLMHFEKQEYLKSQLENCLLASRSQKFAFNFNVKFS